MRQLTRATLNCITCVRPRVPFTWVVNEVSDLEKMAFEEFCLLLLVALFHFQQKFDLQRRQHCARIAFQRQLKQLE